MDALKSVAIWTGVALLILLWLPMLAVRRLLDRDPAHYKTGRLFRKLGKMVSRVNPQWHVHISGLEGIDDRKPYVMVCNHLSQADIPVISNLPWEMKWTAKKELFDVPVVGWMMRLAGDIPVQRRSAKGTLGVFRQASFYLNHHCSVIFFPEGTRSRDGRLRRFSRGAFELAIKNEIPVLPLVLDDTQNCLPKDSWKFGPAKHIKIKVLEPVSSDGLTINDAEQLSRKVRGAMLDQLAAWRGERIHAIDAAR